MGRNVKVTRMARIRDSGARGGRRTGHSLNAPTCTLCAIEMFQCRQARVAGRRIHRASDFMPYRSVLAPNLFAGQLIVVTGGGSGIGRCTAHELSALGAHVVLVGRKAERLTAVANEIAEDGGRATTCPCDVRDEEAVAAMVTHTVTRYGRVHSLVNNTGGQYPSPLEEMKQKGFDAVVRTSLVGGFLLAREVYRQSMKHTGG